MIDALVHEKHSIFHGSVKSRLWRNSLIVSFVLLLLFFAFSSILDGQITFFQFSKSLAGVGAIMIAFSLSLSGFCYYWDFLDTKIGYRKYFGLVGYYYAVLYSVSLLIVDPERYVYGFSKNINTPDFVLGITSMIIFSYVALVSNDSAMKFFGPQRWRKHLRWTYVAWSLLALRAYAIENVLWTEWFRTFAGFPPPRMLLSLLVVAVILFRVSIEVSKKIRKADQSTD